MSFTVIQYLPGSTSHSQGLPATFRLYNPPSESFNHPQGPTAASNVFQCHSAASRVYQSLSGSIRVYQGISGPIRGYQGLSGSIRGYQGLPATIKLYLPPSESINHPQGLTAATNVFHCHSVASKVYQGLSEICSDWYN